MNGWMNEFPYADGKSIASLTSHEIASLPWPVDLEQSTSYFGVLFLGEADPAPDEHGCSGAPLWLM